MVELLPLKEKAIGSSPIGSTIKLNTMSNRRYMVYMKSGRKFMVEEIGDPHISWGNINPATKKLESIYCKMDNVIQPEDSQITKENGFKNIINLKPGTSPLGYIDAIDASGLERFESIDCGTYE